MIRMRLSTLALASLLALPLATACSEGHSPTEPSFDDEASAVSSSSASLLTSVTDESRRGGKGGGGSDDGANKNDDKGRRGRGRGGNGNGNDDRGGNRAPRVGQEFEGAVASVGASSVTLASGLRVVVDGSTQWVSRGDLFSLSQIASSKSAGRNPRVEGRGTRQSDGSILAATIKAEQN